MLSPACGALIVAAAALPTAALLPRSPGTALCPFLALLGLFLGLFCLFLGLLGLLFGCLSLFLRLQSWGSHGRPPQDST